MSGLLHVEQNSTRGQQADEMAGRWSLRQNGWTMSAAAKKILEDALTLPSESRAKVAAALLASLERAADGDPEADAAWVAEIERRAGRVRAGQSARVEASPASPWPAEARGARQAASDLIEGASDACFGLVPGDRLGLPALGTLDTPLDLGDPIGVQLVVGVEPRRHRRPFFRARLCALRWFFFFRFAFRSAGAGRGR